MRRKNFKRPARTADPEHNRLDIGRFVNYVMEDGKKSVAEKIVYDAFEKMGEITKEDPVKVFERAFENATPLVEVVSRRVGGANYQIPQEVRPERKFYLATRWIIDAARGRKGKPMADRLAEELVLAAKNEGSAIKKKQDMHRMAEANRAFASLLRR